MQKVFANRFFKILAVILMILFVHDRIIIPISMDDFDWGDIKSVMHTVGLVICLMVYFPRYYPGDIKILSSIVIILLYIVLLGTIAFLFYRDFFSN